MNKMIKIVMQSMVVLVAIMYSSFSFSQTTPSCSGSDTFALSGSSGFCSPSGFAPTCPSGSTLNSSSTMCSAVASSSPAASTSSDDNVSVQGTFGAFRDAFIVNACSANCEESVRQVRECTGGDFCEGDDQRTIVRSCSPGTGMCPVTALTRGTIQNNRFITQGSSEFSAATALENICPQLQLSGQALTAAQNDLLARCNNIVAEQNDERQFGAVRSIIPEEVTSQAVNLRRMNLGQLSNIASRLSALRGSLSQSTRGLSNNQRRTHVPKRAMVNNESQENGLDLAVNDNSWRINYKERGGAAGDNVSVDNSRWGMFVNGLYGDGNKNQTSSSTGFDFDVRNITVGADYLLTENSIVGLAFGYGSSDTDFSNNSGSLENQTLTLSLYGSRYFGNNWFLDVVVGYGKTDYDSYRNIRYIADNVAVDQVAKGTPKGEQTLFSLGLGKSFTSKSSIDWDFSARVNYLDASIDRFSETALSGSNSGFGLALEIDQQDIESLTSDLNLRISKAFSRDFGVLVPSVALSWIHEYEEGSDNIRARFLNDPFSVNFIQTGLDLPGGGLPTIFTVGSELNDTNYGRVEFGVNALFANSWTFTFLVNKTLGLQDIDYEYYSIGLRKAF